MQERSYINSLREQLNITALKKILQTTVPSTSGTINLALDFAESKVMTP
jgi:hypothetical protein